MTKAEVSNFENSLRAKTIANSGFDSGSGFGLDSEHRSSNFEYLGILKIVIRLRLTSLRRLRLAAKNCTDLFENTEHVFPTADQQIEQE